ncbi:MAG: hypothetical protein C5B43_01370 [Verrucomicrobia bacterium]|nr:MAG: hypothetical protein C5B43_01370 [Verrucomicrobiota bacterium]
MVNKYKEDLKVAQEAIRLAEEAKTEAEIKYAQERLIKEQVWQEKAELEAKLTGEKAKFAQDAMEELSESAGSEKTETQSVIPEIAVDDYESAEEDESIIKIQSIEPEQWQENLLSKQKKITELENEKKQLEQVVKDLQKQGVNENELSTSQANLQTKKKELEELQSKFEKEKLS